MHSNQQYRLFVALSVPEEVKANIESVQSELRPALPAGLARWARREQFHMTLRFLGNIPALRVDELITATQNACRSFPPLRLKAAGLGYFPDARSARVVWVGIQDQAQKLPLVWRAVQDATQPFTVEAPEESFVGHLTLARLNRLRRPELEHLVQAGAKFQDVVFGEWTANRLELMRSELSSQGARHSLLASLPLAG